jgi:hypothetical protein
MIKDDSLDFMSWALEICTTLLPPSSLPPFLLCPLSSLSLPPSMHAKRETLKDREGGDRPGTKKESE